MTDQLPGPGPELDAMDDYSVRAASVKEAEAERDELRATVAHCGRRSSHLQAQTIQFRMWCEPTRPWRKRNDRHGQ